ncbi:MAG: ADOP family duplicated permease, partial [Candidatus Acidiferrales bacterium]
MRTLRAWLLRFTGIFARRRRDREFAEEMESHLQLHIEDNLRSGMTPAEARRQALIKSGGVEQTKETYRDRRGIPFLETLLQDIRFGLRMLRKSPGFTAVAVLTLALGIGANTAIFSVIDAVLLNGLPYPDASRLVILNESLPKMPDTNVSWPDFLDWRAQSRAFEQMAAYAPNTSTLLGAGDPVVIPVQFVSPSYFSLLGIRPYLGRLLDASDDQSKGVAAVVITYSLWRNRLKSDPAIVGKSIDLEGYSTPVVGVLPPDFHDFAGKPDAYGAIGGMSGSPGYTDRANHPGILVLGRLRPGTSLDTARTEMDTIMARLDRQYPKSDRGERATVTPIFTSYLGSDERVLLPLFAAVGFVLLLACANVANLFMARASLRRRELGVRAALGASRSRLIRQLLVESLLLSFLGAGLGLLVAFEADKLFLQLEPAIIPHSQAAVLDPTVLAFTLVAALLTTVLFGLIPSWQTTRLDLSYSLKEYSRDASSPSSQRRLRSALLPFEIAIALVVVVASALMIRSLAATLSVDPGFDAKHVLALDIQIPGNKLNKNGYIMNFVSQTLDRISHLPGVLAAGAAMNPPLIGLRWTSPYVLAGQPEPPPTEWPDTALNMVTPDYFRTIGTPLLAGRYFTESDNATSIAVAIVNRTMALRISPNASAVGKQLRVRYAAHPLVQVIGVVSDLKQYGLNTKDWPEVFVPFAQMPVSFMTLMIRASDNPSSVERAATLAIHRVNPEQPVSHVVPLASYISASVRQQRFLAWLLGASGVLALILAAVGVYGVVAYSISQRTHEIGLRMALGAQPRDILRLVVRQDMLLAAIGVVCGIGSALALTRFLRSLLFEIKPTDPLTFVGAAILLTLVA